MDNALKSKIMISYIAGGIIILLVCFTIVLPAIKRRRRKRKIENLTRACRRLVAESRLAIEYSEYIGYRFIGMDRRNRKLVLVDHSGEHKQELCIPLVQIGDSKVITETDDSSKLKAVFLELKNKWNNKILRFPFYDSAEDSEWLLPTLSKKAIYWKTTVDIHKRIGGVGVEGLL